MLFLFFLLLLTWSTELFMTFTLVNMNVLLHFFHYSCFILLFFPHAIFHVDYLLFLLENLYSFISGVQEFAWIYRCVSFSPQSIPFSLQTQVCLQLMESNFCCQFNNVSLFQITIDDMYTKSVLKLFYLSFHDSTWLQIIYFMVF